jgi:2-methylisocitrate lyase-like PEP mutase family enzyme
LVNVWDVASARVVAGVDGTRAIATASHSIAASRGYEDGENIPVDEMIHEVGLIAAATDLPVTADLEGGYGDAPETIRKAIGVGAVGANIEDQMRPLREAAAQVEAVVKAAQAEGLPDFVLNARTDAFLRAGDRNPADVLADAVERGRAFLDAGAPVVFVPGVLDEEQTGTLVDAFGPRRLTMIGLPGIPRLERLAELGVARVSYGPVPQRVALTALAKLAEAVHAGGGAPDDTRALN